MGKLFKIIGFSITLFVLLIIAGLIVLVVLIKPNDLKPLILDQVYKMTGRTLTIKGDIHWNILPTLGFKINDATLSNPPEFKDQSFAQIEHARIDIAIEPLLQRKIITKDLVIRGLTIHLMKNKQGANNWDNLIQTKKTEKVVSGNQQNHKQHKFELQIPNIHIKNATVNWTNELKNQHSSIKNINIDANNIFLKKSIPITITAFIENQKPKINGQLKIKTQLSINTEKQIFELNNLIAMTQLIGPTLPNQKLNLNLSGQLKVSPNKALLKPLSITANENTITGYVLINNLSKMAGEFHLMTNELNLDQWSNKQKTTQSKSKKVTLKQENTNIISALKNFNMNGELKIKKLTTNKLTFNNVTTKITAKNGLITVSPINAQFYQGRYIGKTILNVQPSIPTFNIQSYLTNVNFQSVLKDLVNYKNITGTSNVQINIQTRGLDTKTMIKNLNGTGSFAIKNGVIQGIDVAHYLRVVNALIAKQNAPKQKANKQTEFETFSGTASIQNGLITCNDLKVISKTALIEGHGTIDLVTEKINYHIEAREPHVQAHTLQTAPIIITGNYHDPNINLDTHRVLEKIRDMAIKNLKENAKEKIKDLIKNKKLNILGSLGF